MYLCFAIVQCFYRPIQKYYLPIYFLFLLVVLVETTGFVYRWNDSVPSIYIYEVYQVLASTLIGLFFFKTTKLHNKPLALITGTLFPLWVLLITFLGPPLFSLESRGIYISYSIGLIIICLAYYIFVLKYLKDVNLLKTASFYIFTAFFLYYSGSFMLLGLVNYIYETDPILAQKAYSISHLLNIIQYGLITYAFYIQWKSTKSSLSS